MYTLPASIDLDQDAKGLWGTSRIYVYSVPYVHQLIRAIYLEHMNMTTQTTVLTILSQVFASDLCEELTISGGYSLFM